MSKLYEITVYMVRAGKWRWTVSVGGEVIDFGSARTQAAARTAARDAKNSVMVKI